jgi:hypothetical protein
VASGLYHGANPGMGWPLAVSAGLMERSSRALFAALWPLAVGHLLAMLVVMLPFAFLAALVQWQRQIRIGASLLVIAFGIFLLVNPAIYARWRGYHQHNWESDPSPWRLLMGRDLPAEPEINRHQHAPTSRSHRLDLKTKMQIPRISISVRTQVC